MALTRKTGDQGVLKWLCANRKKMRVCSASTEGDPMFKEQIKTPPGQRDQEMGEKKKTSLSTFHS